MQVVNAFLACVHRKDCSDKTVAPKKLLRTNLYKLSLAGDNSNKNLKARSAMIALKNIFLYLISDLVVISKKFSIWGCDPFQGHFIHVKWNNKKAFWINSEVSLIKQLYCCLECFLKLSLIFFSFARAEITKVYLWYDMHLQIDWFEFDLLFIRVAKLQISINFCFFHTLFAWKKSLEKVPTFLCSFARDFPHSLL